ncbi:hypothetical protein D3C78_1191550 [compost metagenome]
MAQTNHQRATAAGRQQAVRLVGADHCQTISAMQLLDCGLQGIGQVRNGLQGVMQQVDDDFGVGLRAEYITQALKLFTQLFMVLDDAVMHHRQLVTGEMRVGIAFCWRTVGGPTSVSDTQLAGQRIGGNSGFQLTNLTDAATTLQGSLLGINR